MHYDIDNTNHNALKVSIFGNVLSNSDTEILRQAVYEKLEVFISSNGKANVIFDLKELEMISSLGIGFFLSTLKKCKQEGGDIELKNLNDKLKRIIQITKLSDVFKIG